MHILLIGPPASGKGTVGEKISKDFSIPLISVGGVLRSMSENHPQKKRIDDIMESGELVPQDITAELLKEEVAKDSARNGFIFDGWGRRKEDLDYFDPGFDKVIYLKVSPETSIKRINARRTCDNCEAVFNLVSVPPKVPGVCDFCGGNLVQREDESEETTRRRLEIFDEETRETIDYFKNQGRLIEIDGEGTPNEVYELVKKALSC
ncbi:MAG: nucleoside monophosphate kinase [Patescibacteria group bacterium]